MFPTLDLCRSINVIYKSYQEALQPFLVMLTREPQDFIPLSIVYSRAAPV